MTSPEMAAVVDPPMYTPHPSVGRRQDVSHILSRIFHDVYAEDVVDQQTVYNLTVSRGGNDTYHEQYVERLRQIQVDHDRRVQEAAMLERHIMQAHAKAIAADEAMRELRVDESGAPLSDLGLPPGKTGISTYLNTDLLRSYDLIVPEDFLSVKKTQSSQQKGSRGHLYTRSTMNSRERTRPLPRDDGYNNDMINDDIIKSAARTTPTSTLSRYSGCTGEEGPPTPEPEDFREMIPPIWMETNTPIEREEERRMLKRLHERASYLRNPRSVCPSIGGHSLIHPKKQRSPDPTVHADTKSQRCEDIGCFISNPSTVTFQEYRVGDVYELTLELKNVTSASRQCRVIPPTTPYFSLSLGKYPDDQGLVAPGMCCQYNIRFAPDSLADYDDHIIVQSQSKSPLIVPLQARREPPNIDISQTLNCGHCLVGGAKLIEFSGKNNGGEGKFCIISKDLWPAANFRTIVTKESVDLRPFEVRPAVFELLKGDVAVIEVLFAPTTVGVFNASMIIICDNCQVKEFTLKGVSETAGCELTSVEGGETSPELGESVDITAQHFIKFNTLNPMTYTHKTITIRNSSNVAQAYYWRVLKPFLAPPGGDRVQVSVTEREWDDESPFSVIPDDGTLPAGGSIDTCVIFAAPYVGNFHNVLHFVLQNLPQLKPTTSEGTPRGEGRGGDYNICVSGTGVGTAPHHRLSRSQTFPSLNKALPSVQSAIGEMKVSDQTIVEIDIKAECTDFNVTLVPYALIIPGEHTYRTTIKKQFQMFNTSVSAVYFRWDRVSEPDIIQVEPPTGNLPPGSVGLMEICITPDKPGKLQHTLTCIIDNKQLPIGLQIEADIKGPELCIETPSLDFGLVRLGESVYRSVNIVNVCEVNAVWTFSETQETKQGDWFIFTPCSGVLPPRGLVTVLVEFTPTISHRLRTMFQLSVQDGHTQHLCVQSETQGPSVCLLNCELHLSNIYTQVTDRHFITLVNQTALDTLYKWGDVIGEDSSNCVVNFEPSYGRLTPREQCSIAVDFTANTTGDINDVRVACFIDGMSEVLWLSISATVKSLSVQYTLIPSTPSQSDSLLSPTSKTTAKSLSPVSAFEPSPSDRSPSNPPPSYRSPSNQQLEQLRVEFGEVELGSMVHRRIKISNPTAILAPFKLRYRNLPGADPPNIITQRRLISENRSNSNSLLRKTTNLADPSSKTQERATEDYCRAVLKNNNGVAFTVEPSKGILQPFSSIVVNLTVFSDMFGDYHDFLISEVESLDSVYIPVNVQVIGCPLNFQLTAAIKHLQPIVRFGTHVPEADTVHRSMRINNTSPCDIRLDWEVLLTDDHSDKLLDLLVIVGEAFPLLDKHGNKIYNNTNSIQSSSETEGGGQRGHSPSVTVGNYSSVGGAATDRTEDTTYSSPCDPQSPKLISVKLRPHEGVKHNCPFTVTPRQLIIPGRGTVNIDVSFTPKQQSNGSELQFSGFCLGYMSLTDDLQSTNDGTVSRSHGYDVTPLRLEMTAAIKPALLTIEYEDTSSSQDFKFTAPASQLLTSDHMCVCDAVARCTNVVKLCNYTGTPLYFQLITSDPFTVSNVHTGRSSVVKDDDTYCLPAQKHFSVRVTYRLTLDSVTLANTLTPVSTTDNSDLGSQTDCEGGENTWLTADNEERRLHHSRTLDIMFNNGTVQTLPMEAVMILPSFTLSEDVVDFGVCFVGQERTKQLSISNYTGSATTWRIHTDSETSNCDKDVFSISPEIGHIKAYITHSVQRDQRLHVSFTPRNDDEYVCEFVFRGLLGEEIRRLRVVGSGSYDGKYEAFVNI